MPVQWGTNPAVSQSAFLLRGLLAARPAAAPANEDYYFLATDDNGGTLYQSDGSDWVQVAGAVDDPDVNTFAALTDVDTTGQVNGQIFAWNAQTGFYQPLVGVMGSWNGDLQILGGILQGVSGSDTVSNNDLFGPTNVVSDGATTSGANIAFAVQQQDVAPLLDDLAEVGRIERVVARVAGRGIAPILVIRTADGGDGSVPVVEGEVLLRTTSPFGIGVQINAAGGLAMFAQTPPTAQPTGGAATAGATYGATEQTMLQAVYDAARAIGLLS